MLVVAFFGLFRKSDQTLRKASKIKNEFKMIDWMNETWHTSLENQLDYQEGLCLLSET